MKFEPLPHIRASELIENRIKQAIIDGKLKPGDKLPAEKQIAQQFGVSMVTLREALRGLQLLGLIEKKKGQKGGVFVSEIDSGMIKDSLSHYMCFKDLSANHLYEVRKIIEPSAVKLAVQNITTDELGELEENVHYCEERVREIGPFIDKKDFFDLDDKNNSFHRFIASSTHNPILTLTIDYIFDFLKGCETTYLIPDFNYTSENIKDHRNILEHLKRRDGEKCQQEMTLHLNRLDEYLSTLKKKNQRKKIVFSLERKSNFVHRERR